MLSVKLDPANNGTPGLSETYTYYSNGLMASKIDRNGISTGYTYDIFGRLTQENAGGEQQSYTYDANGNTLTMTDASGTTTRAYDELNRNTVKTVPVIGTSTYYYDLSTGTAGEYMEQTTDPKGNITKKTYDKMGRLSKVTVGTETTGYAYYRNGRQYRITYPNQTTETYLYDAANQVTKLVNANSNGSVLSTYDYTYDAAGNQTSKTDAKGMTSYSYDKSDIPNFQNTVSWWKMDKNHIETCYFSFLTGKKHLFRSSPKSIEVWAFIIKQDTKYYLYLSYCG